MNNAEKKIQLTFTPTLQLLFNATYICRSSFEIFPINNICLSVQRANIISHRQLHKLTHCLCNFPADDCLIKAQLNGILGVKLAKQICTTVSFFLLLIVHQTHMMLYLALSSMKSVV